MTSGKEEWKKPELLAFRNVEEATAYFTLHDKPEHVAAVKRLFAQRRQVIDSQEQLKRRVTRSR